MSLLQALGCYLVCLVGTNLYKVGILEIHEKLSLTGAEISLNELPAGANVPFVHSHKENEEIYGILSGNGKAIIDAFLEDGHDGSIWFSASVRCPAISGKLLLSKARFP